MNKHNYSFRKMIGLRARHRFNIIDFLEKLSEASFLNGDALELFL